MTRQLDDLRLTSAAQIKDVRMGQRMAIPGSVLKRPRPVPPVTAVPKGRALLAEPVTSHTVRLVRVLQGERQLILGFLLLSGVFARAARFTGLFCFALFSLITVYKGVTRTACCGCFRSVHVNSWASLLALNAPVAVTVAYEVLQPETWIGKELPILEHIDIAEQVRRGTRLVLFYHHDCPDCRRAIPQYEQMARDLAGNEDFLRIALIEVRPYGPSPASSGSPCTVGGLDQTNEWSVTTAASALLTDGQVISAWEGNAPDLDTILKNYERR